MAKDNITHPSLITLGKTFSSSITNAIIDESTITNQLVHNSPIGIEDEVVIQQGIDHDIIEDTLIVY